MAGRDPFMRSIAEAFGTIDLDEVDVDNDPGAQDFDADEYLESKAPKPYNEDDYRTRRDTPQDQAAVKRAYEDRAARQADEMMAAYGMQLQAPSMVASRLEDQKAQEETQRRLLAIEWLKGGGR
jgi:hypothetical protein